MSTDSSFKQNDAVAWHGPNGKVIGTVIEIITTHKTVQVGANQSMQVKASVDNPMILVESCKTKKHAVHHPAALHKLKKV